MSRSTAVKTRWFPADYGVKVPDRLRSLTTDGMLSDIYGRYAEAWTAFSQDVFAVNELFGHLGDLWFSYARVMNRALDDRPACF